MTAGPPLDISRAGPLVAAAACLSLALAGCPGECDRRTEPADRLSGPWPHSSPLRAKIPAEADTVLFVRRLGDLGHVDEFVADELPGQLVERFWPEAWRASGLAGLTKLVEVSRLGLHPGQPAVVFRDGGAWGLVTAIPDRRSFEAGLRKILDETPVGAADGDNRIERLTYPRAGDDEAEPRTIARLRHRDETLFARFGSAEDLQAQEDLADGDGDLWPADRAHGQLLDGLASDDARLVALGNPSEMVPTTTASQQARRIRDRLAGQLGPTGVSASFDAEPATLSFDLRARPTPEQPVVVSTLGTPDDQVPALGGLIEPGVLGVARFSVDPESTYRLFRSTLPARHRRQLDAFWQQLRDKLLIDGPDALLDHFTGHAFVVVDALGSDSETPPADWRQVLKLQATREVVVLPIASRERLERALDKATQVTRGRLSRQTGDDNVQYAWFEGGTLAWAMILSDEHLMFVDSPSSLDRALAFDRNDEAVSDEIRAEMQIGPLLETTGRSGAYLDAALVDRQLSERGHERAAAWLTPFESILLTTEMDGEASHTRLEFVLDGE